MGQWLPMSSICPNGHHNEGPATFCGVCGATVEPGVTPPPGAPAEPTIEVPVAPPPVDDSVMPSTGQATPAATDGPWIASHRVPPEGLDVRSEPAPHLPAVTRLPAGTQLQVQEWKGAWARVTIPSGWGGWVDGRRLVDINAPMPAQPPQQQQPWAQLGYGAATPHPGHAAAPAGGWAAPAADRGTQLSTGPVVTVIGAAAALISTFLPWLGWGVGAIKAYDVPFTYLWSTNPQQSGFSIGLVAAILSGVVLLVVGLMATGGVPASAATLVSFGGGLYLALTLAFVFQTIRRGLDFNIPFGDIVTDFFGIGAWVALGGAIVITVGARIRPR